MKWEYLILEAEQVKPLRDLEKPYRHARRGIDLAPGQPFPSLPYYETVWKKNGVEDDSLNSIPAWEALNLFGTEGWELVSADYDHPYGVPTYTLKRPLPTPHPFTNNRPEVVAKLGELLGKKEQNG